MSYPEFYERAPQVKAVFRQRPSPNDLAATDEFFRILNNSGIGEWAMERRKLREYVMPRMLYIHSGSQHPVAWVAHRDTRSRVDGQLLGDVSDHHVVCSCAANNPSDDWVDDVAECDFVQSVLKQRAQEVGHTRGVDKVLGGLAGMGESTSRYLSQDLVAVTLASVLEIDRRRPEEWMANRFSGQHEVESLASIVRQEPQVIIPMLEELEEIGVLTLDGDLVKL